MDEPLPQLISAAQKQNVENNLIIELDIVFIGSLLGFLLI
jgi:hypothetical protein